jgi:uncharacterized membrane protein (UPF0127 family)
VGIIAETWAVDQSVQLKVHRLSGRHRLTGAITLGVPRQGEAFLFRDCRSLHGWFMRASLDVAFVGEDGRVLRVAELRPWRAHSCRGAAHAFEFARGDCAALGIVRGATLKNISI